MEYPVQQGNTAIPLVFLLPSSTDHITGLTGKAGTVVITISKNGTGGFVTPAGAISEVGNGVYAVAPTATDASTLGVISLHAKDAASDPVDITFMVVAYNPLSTSLGLILAKTANITGFNDVAASAIVTGGAINTSGGKVSEVALVDTLATYTGNTPQTGDSYARMGASGAGLTAVALASFGFTVTVGTNQDKSGYSLSGGGVTAVQAGLATLSALAPLASNAMPVGTVAAGSTGAAAVVSGLPPGRNYAGQRLYHYESGESRSIASQSYASPDYTFDFTGDAGTEAGPFSSLTAGDTVSPIP